MWVSQETRVQYAPVLRHGDLDSAGASSLGVQISQPLALQDQDGLRLETREECVSPQTESWKPHFQPSNSEPSKWLLGRLVLRLGRGRRAS